MVVGPAQIQQESRETADVLLKGWSDEVQNKTISIKLKRRKREKNFTRLGEDAIKIAEVRI